MRGRGGGRLFPLAATVVTALLLLALWALPPHPARAADSDPFAAITATNADVEAKGVQALAVSGDPRAHAVIDALRDGKLFTWKWPRPDAPL
ncbi:MAG: hypothetical protein ACREDY_04775, partial [Bradyrhizobium sp.]